MFIPGSHRWDDERVPRMDEVCFVGEQIDFYRPIKERFPC